MLEFKGRWEQFFNPIKRNRLISACLIYSMWFRSWFEFGSVMKTGNWRKLSKSTSQCAHFQMGFVNTLHPVSFTKLNQFQSHSPRARFFCDLPRQPYDGEWSTHGQLHISSLMMSMLQKTAYRRVNNMLKISCYDKKNKKIGQ